MNYSLTWDLESIFPGGSDSQKFAERLQALRTTSLDYQAEISSWQVTEDRPEFTAFSKLIKIHDQLSDGFTECFSFVNALQSQNVNDRKAIALQNQLQIISNDFQKALVMLSKKIVAIPETDWQAILQTEELAASHFPLNEIREQGQELLSEAEENLLSVVAVDGFLGWSSHYDTLQGNLSLDFSGETLSVGQAFNKMMGDPDADVRAQLFEKWEATWSQAAPLAADTLNHLSGFRLSSYQLHGIDNFMKKPLQYNRMQAATLNAMWEAVAENKAIFSQFLQRKAQLFGKEKLDWQDQDAPITLGDAKARFYTFDEAADFIIQHFANFSPKMAEFAKMAFANRWIEAEDRPGKLAGGYCEDFPESGVSRIFLTYSGSINEVATIAHELGHAFHSHVMRDLPAIRREYAMNVAETASTLAELVVADATLKEAESPAQKLQLLDAKLQNAIAMFFNIHARFLFETQFYQARKERVLSDQELSDLMVAAQKEAYADSLASYHPHFWASKLHFYIADVPFYNFPYTFGYLFSLGIYAVALEKGPAFQENYIALLRDTASMSVEDLAQKHLQVDLTQKEFWCKGIQLAAADVQEFLRLSEAFLPKK